MIEYINTVLILILLIGLAMFIKFYLPGYFKKKGENLADKEDIKEITEKIEDVKSSYIIEIEKIKSNLQLEIFKKSKSEDRINDSLLKLYEDCTILLFDKFSTNIADLPIDNGKSIFEFNQSIEKLFSSIIIDVMKIKAYCNNTNLISTINIFVSSIDEIKKVFNKNKYNVKIKLQKEGAIMLNPNSHEFEKDNAVRETNETLNKYREELKNPLDKLFLLYSDFSGLLNEYFNN